MRNVAYFNARFLEPVCRFMGRNDIRYYLNGVQLEPAAAGGVLLIATDGHTMLIARDPEGWVKDKMIIKPDNALIAAAKRKGMGKCVIQQAADSFANGLAFVLPAKIGKSKRAFPVDRETELKWIAEPLTAVEHVSAVDFIDHETGVQWRRVLPTVEEKGSHGYADVVANAHYLARFDGAFDDMEGKIGRRRLGGIRIQSYSENGTMTLRPAGKELNAIGLVMPMALDRTPFDPSWLAAQTPKRRIRIRAGESAPLEAAE